MVPQRTGCCQQVSSNGSPNRSIDPVHESRGAGHAACGCEIRNAGQAAVGCGVWTRGVRGALHGGSRQNGDMSFPRPRRVVWCCGIALVVALVPAACGDSGSSTTASAESAERGSSEGRGGSGTDAGGDEEYCAALERLAADGTDVDLTEDPDAALAEVRSLAEAAPPEIAEDFEVFLGTIERLATIPDDETGEALGELFEVMLDPEFMAARERIDQYSSDECGIDFDDLGSAGGPDDLGGDMGDLGDDEFGSGLGEDDPTDISLEDIDAVEEANDGTAWEEKLSSTVISMGADVQLGSGPDAFTVDEALAMCTAMFDALSAKNPDVTIAVANGETTIVDTSSGSCAAV